MIFVYGRLLSEVKNCVWEKGVTINGKDFCLCVCRGGAGLVKTYHEGGYIRSEVLFMARVTIRSGRLVQGAYFICYYMGDTGWRFDGRFLILVYI